MSFLAGSIVKFNCCQNGRDLPPDNKQRFINGKSSYPCGCPHHFFLIVSARRFNDHLSSDWSKMRSSNDQTYFNKSLKFCTAIPLDKVADVSKINSDKIHWMQIDTNDEIIETVVTQEDLRHLKYLRNNQKSAVLCSHICKINISQAETGVLGYLKHEIFLSVIKEVNNFMTKGYNELEFTIKKIDNK